MTDATGHYLLPCLPATSSTITVEAEGFAQGTAQARSRAGEMAHVNLQLALASVQADVQVSGDTAADPNRGPGTTDLNRNEVQQLADDPDDFLRQLQVLAANGGGAVQSVILTVDGFRNASVLPPKSSIASIRVHPDDFLAEYDGPTWFGGRVEVTTKSGADAFHGALFFTDSDGSFNATDPFSLTATPAGKRRYGFELSGPLLQKKNGFSLALEKRDIDEFNVVNAVTVDADGNAAPFQQTVAAPQRLWIASARTDWQVTPKDTAALSFSANVNTLGNLGVGGLTLAEAGYSSLMNEYDLRLVNTQVLSANLLHESRIGYTWKRTQQTPLSVAPSLQVAGYFTGGGATSGNLNERERDLELDEDLAGTHGKHSWKIGVQSLGVFLHYNDPDTFNGAYVFGGGNAPQLDANDQPTGQTTTLTPIQQYQRALQNLPGGAPTTYQLTTGTPVVPLTQWRVALYGEDTIALTPHLTIAPGFRYEFQTSPGSFGNLGPRVGVSWSPDQKQNWVFHLHGGLFRGIIDSNAVTMQADRLNGVRQQQTTVYSPDYDHPLTPVAGSIQVTSINSLSPSLTQNYWYQLRVGVEHEFPHHWHPEASYYWGGDWKDIQLRNINAPIVPSSVGTAPDPTAALLAPRPLAPNENIFQYLNAGHLTGGFLFLALNQSSYKWFGLHAGYIHLNLRCITCVAYEPQQSSYSNQGESSRPDWLARNSFNLFGTLHLPHKLEFATQFDASSGRPYNITTGTDNNGDGNFNDRPSYASAMGPGVYNTHFGLLTTNTVNGNVPRNLGTMPGLIHLDLNLSRAFTLNPNDKDHLRTLTFNARSANVLNHTNVTAVGTVVSSSNFSAPLTAEAARRIELGVRFSF